MWTAKGKPKVEAQPKKVSFCEKYKGKPSESILVIGDSLARGVGSCLERQNGNMIRKQAYGGARIEDIEQRVGEMGDKPDSHLVVAVGTNNLIADGYVKMKEKYESLFSKIKNHSYKMTSVVEILDRSDVGVYINSRRMGVNVMLKKLCTKHGFGFIEANVSSEQLGMDGLHLNSKGQDAVARAIFGHCKCF